MRADRHFALRSDECPQALIVSVFGEWTVRVFVKLYECPIMDKDTLRGAPRLGRTEDFEKTLRQMFLFAYITGNDRRGSREGPEAPASRPNEEQRS